LELEPVSPAAIADLGRAHGVAGRHEEAIALYQRSLELAPTWSAGWGELANTLMVTDRMDEARHAWMESARLAGIDLVRAQEAFDGIARHTETGEPQVVPSLGSRIAFDFIAHSRGGDLEMAVNIARRTLDQGAVGFFGMNYELYASPALLAEPAYQALLARAGITW
jgi:tetratricopeptide (TPR) repeat protein